jgi:CDP-diacylglycerol--glycerol-3-phosphate 3-phosphatidyltransferase
MSALSNDLKKIPNLITLSRFIFLAIALFFFYGLQSYQLGLFFGILAGLTDFFDGYFARKLNQSTWLGEVLDLFSDLVFESIALILMITYPNSPFGIFWLVAYLIREFWVTSIRRFLAWHQINIKSNIFGKIKSHFLGWGFLVIFSYLSQILPTSIQPFAYYLSYFALTGAMFLSYYSGYLYHMQWVKAYETLKTQA